MKVTKRRSRFVIVALASIISIPAFSVPDNRFIELGQNDPFRFNSLCLQEILTRPRGTGLNHPLAGQTDVNVNNQQIDAWGLSDSQLLERRNLLQSSDHLEGDALAQRLHDEDVTQRLASITSGEAREANRAALVTLIQQICGHGEAVLAQTRAGAGAATPGGVPRSRVIEELRAIQASSSNGRSPNVSTEALAANLSTTLVARYTSGSTPPPPAPQVTEAAPIVPPAPVVTDAPAVVVTPTSDTPAPQTTPTESAGGDQQTEIPAPPAPSVPTQAAPPEVTPTDAAPLTPTEPVTPPTSRPEPAPSTPAPAPAPVPAPAPAPAPVAVRPPSVSPAPQAPSQTSGRHDRLCALGYGIMCVNSIGGGFTTDAGLPGSSNFAAQGFAQIDFGAPHGRVWARAVGRISLPIANGSGRVSGEIRGPEIVLYEMPLGRDGQVQLFTNPAQISAYANLFPADGRPVQSQIRWDSEAIALRIAGRAGPVEVTFRTSAGFTAVQMDDGTGRTLGGSGLGGSVSGTARLNFRPNGLALNAAGGMQWFTGVISGNSPSGVTGVRANLYLSVPTSRQAPRVSPTDESEAAAGRPVNNTVHAPQVGQTASAPTPAVRTELMIGGSYENGNTLAGRPDHTVGAFVGVTTPGL